MYNGVKHQSLIVKTRALLTERPVTKPLSLIAENIDVSESWLSTLIAGGGSDYGANRVQRLYEYLSGKPLFTDNESDDSTSPAM